MLPPSDRLKQLAKQTETSVDPNRKIIMYYKSANVMMRTAEMNYSDGHLEDAYKLFLKYITLFLKDIRTHPKFNEVPASLKDENTASVKAALHKAEEIKSKLKEKYKREYDVFLEQQQRELQRQQEEFSKMKLLQEKQHEESTEQKTTLSPESPMWEPNIYSDTSLSGVNFPRVDVLPQMPNLIKNDKSTAADHPDNEKRTPTVDRSTKPVGLINQSSQRLKTVVIPSELFGSFKNLAHKATLKDIETCGILAGRLESSNLVITHVLIPKQHGTPNSCAAENEEEVFDYQDQNNLITLGWIHTHPSQTAFLSSVDLHTHCPYQLMMPEAIAIVCAPKYKQDGIFCLTPDYGLEFISKCRQSGFHPHPSDVPLFMEAEHIRMDSTRNILVVDLRS